MQSEHLVIHVVRKHGSLVGEQVRTEHQSENSSQQQCCGNTNQVHQTDALVIKRESPRLPTLGVVEVVRRRGVEDFVSDFCGCHDCYLCSENSVLGTCSDERAL